MKGLKLLKECCRVKEGDRVYCYYDTVVPKITGIVEKNILEKQLVKVKCDKYGILFFPYHKVFAKYWQWKKYKEEVEAPLREKNKQIQEAINYAIQNDNKNTEIIVEALEFLQNKINSQYS